MSKRACGHPPRGPGSGRAPVPFAPECRSAWWETASVSGSCRTCWRGGRRRRVMAASSGVSSCAGGPWGAGVASHWCFRCPCGPGRAAPCPAPPGRGGQTGWAAHASLAYGDGGLGHRLLRLPSSSSSSGTPPSVAGAGGEPAPWQPGPGRSGGGAGCYCCGFCCWRPRCHDWTSFPPSWCPSSLWALPTWQASSPVPAPSHWPVPPPVLHRALPMSPPAEPDIPK